MVKLIASVELVNTINNMQIIGEVGLVLIEEDEIFMDMNDKYFKADLQL